nr:MAG TPA: hypothetical protein [Bacteriophage sp.]
MFCNLHYLLVTLSLLIYSHIFLNYYLYEG